MSDGQDRIHRDSCFKVRQKKRKKTIKYYRSSINPYAKQDRIINYKTSKTNYSLNLNLVMKYCNIMMPHMSML